MGATGIIPSEFGDTVLKLKDALAANKVIIRNSKTR
jgi:hypothetical protein